MLMRAWIFAIAAVLTSCELTGDHVCLVEEQYPVNVTEYSLQNATVRNYKWCMGFPPRCSFYTFQTVKVPHVIEKYETRTIKKCCPGYAKSKNGDGCVHCNKCLEGSCGIDGICICNPGFQGEDCGNACDPLHWGLDCTSECACERGICNPRSGKCECPSGWFGTRCELLCLEGFYGKHCTKRCRCGERDLCNPETGECLKKHSSAHQTTRAIHYMTEDVFNITRTKPKHMSTPSLTKYHTFDMELSSVRPIRYNLTTDIYKTTKKPMQHNTNTDINMFPKYSTTRLSNSTPQKPSLRPKTTTQTKKITVNLDESIESTTEISAEIPIRKEKNYLFINENGSIEKKENINSRENSAENRNDLHRKLENNKRPGKENSDMSGGTKRKSAEGEQSAETKPSTKKQLNNTSAESKKSIKNKKPFKKSETTSSTEIQKSTKDSHRITVVTNNTANKNSIFTSKSPPKNANNDKNSTLKTGKEPHNFDKTTTPIIHLKIKKDFVTEATIAKSTEFLKTTTEDSNQLESKPTLIKATPPISVNRNPIEGAKQKIMEEDELQNLDKSNVLTSMETSTALNTLITTADSVTHKTKEVLYFTEIPPSTRSLNEELGNEITTAGPPLIKLKDAVDSHHRREENYLSDKSSGEFDYSTTENDNFSTHISMAILITFLMVLSMTIFIIVHHFIRRKKKREVKTKSDHHNYSGGPTVSVYTHSIFHTPLPEPPSFESPVFTTPVETSADHRTFQTHVVCSLNFPKTQRSDEKELKEYTYDHPPSTGSYRAASIPEPPDITEMVNTTEPVYDEIPSNGRMNSPASPPPSYKSSCIYVNTCGKTRF